MSQRRDSKSKVHSLCSACNHDIMLDNVDTDLIPTRFHPQTQLVELPQHCRKAPRRFPSISNLLQTTLSHLKRKSAPQSTCISGPIHLLPADPISSDCLRSTLTSPVKPLSRLIQPPRTCTRRLEERKEAIYRAVGHRNHNILNARENIDGSRCFMGACVSEPRFMKDATYQKRPWINQQDIEWSALAVPDSGEFCGTIKTELQSCPGVKRNESWSKMQHSASIDSHPCSTCTSIQTSNISTRDDPEEECTQATKDNYENFPNSRYSNKQSISRLNKTVTNEPDCCDSFLTWKTGYTKQSHQDYPEKLDFSFAVLSPFTLTPCDDHMFELCNADARIGSSEASQSSRSTAAQDRQSPHNRADGHDGNELSPDNLLHETLSPEPLHIQKRAFCCRDASSGRGYDASSNRTTLMNRICVDAKSSSRIEAANHTISVYSDTSLTTSWAGPSDDEETDRHPQKEQQEIGELMWVHARGFHDHRDGPRYQEKACKCVAPGTSDLRCQDKVGKANVLLFPEKSARHSDIAGLMQLGCQPPCRKLVQEQRIVDDRRTECEIIDLYYGHS